MTRIKREFYEVDEAAQILEISVSDLWHLIELGKINANVRNAIVPVTFGIEELNSYLACHTFLIPNNVARILAARGTSLLKYAYLELLEPREKTIVEMDGNGEDCIVLSYTHEFQLNNQIEIHKSDVVITQKSIEKYIQSAAKYNSFYKSETNLGSGEKPLDNYSTDFLDILNLAVNNFFNPRKNLDAKKEEVTEWIISKGAELEIYVSSNVADAIFTIIKPDDHNPKIKRA
jgi:hypothetical protein